jgi:hypothetical protein
MIVRSGTSDIARLIGLMLISVLSAGLFSFSPGELSVRVSINPVDRSIPVKLYWRKRDAQFSEQNSVATAVGAGENEPSVRFTKPKDMAQLRLDFSLGYQEVLGFRNIRIERRDCLLPLSRWCSAELNARDAVALNQMDPNQFSANRIKRTGVDPYVVWKFPQILNASYPVLVMNVGVMGLVFLILGVLTGTQRKAYSMEGGKGVWKSAAVFFVYPVLLVVLEISESYFGAITIRRELFLLISAVFGILVVRNGLSRESSVVGPIKIAALIIIGASLSADVLFRLDWIQSWRFGAEPGQYHWQVGRQFLTNVENSSLKYRDDLRDLNDHINPGALVLSDVATSVYVAASTNYYVVNPLPHHRLPDSTLSSAELEILCDETASWEALREILMRFKVQYLIVNKDTQNPNLGLSCPALRSAIIATRFPSNFENIFEGKWLSAYQLSY